jgi:hypothetical protein
MKQLDSAKFVANHWTLIHSDNGTALKIRTLYSLISQIAKIKYKK